MSAPESPQETEKGKGEKEQQSQSVEQNKDKEQQSDGTGDEYWEERDTKNADSSNCTIDDEEEDDEYYLMYYSDEDEEDQQRGCFQWGSSKNERYPVTLPQQYDWSSEDTKRYRAGYPGKEDSTHDRKNFQFYNNEIPYEPRGITIEEFHEQMNPMKHTGSNRDRIYDDLEWNHSYIQWLFPIREQGMNRYAQELQQHEIKDMLGDEVIRKRLMTSYVIMLDFYGLKLIDEKTGKVDRTENYMGRFRNLNHSSHNYLRITRILKCLGEFEMEDYKAPFIKFMLREAIITQRLRNVLNSCMCYWLEVVRSDKERKKIRKLAEKMAAEVNDKTGSSEQQNRRNRIHPKNDKVQQTAASPKLSIAKSQNSSTETTAPVGPQDPAIRDEKVKDSSSTDDKTMKQAPVDTEALTTRNLGVEESSSTENKIAEETNPALPVHIKHVPVTAPTQVVEFTQLQTAVVEEKDKEEAEVKEKNESNKTNQQKTEEESEQQNKENRTQPESSGIQPTLVYPKAPETTSQKMEDSSSTYEEAVKLEVEANPQVPYHIRLVPTQSPAANPLGTAVEQTDKENEAEDEKKENPKETNTREREGGNGEKTDVAEDAIESMDTSENATKSDKDLSVEHGKCQRGIVEGDKESPMDCKTTYSTVDDTKQSAEDVLMEEEPSVAN